MWTDDEPPIVYGGVAQPTHAIGSLAVPWRFQHEPDNSRNGQVFTDFYYT